MNVEQQLYRVHTWHNLYSFIVLIAKNSVILTFLLPVNVVTRNVPNLNFDPLAVDENCASGVLDAGGGEVFGREMVPEV